MELIIDNLKPKVGSVYSYAWGTMKKYFLPLFLVLIVTGIIGIPANMLNQQPMFKFNAHHMEGWSCMFHQSQNPAGAVMLKIFGLAYSLFIILPIGFGAKYVRLKAVRNENIDVKEVFSGFKNYLNVVLAALLSGSIVIIGFLFLIIPGIIFACRLAFVPYLVMDKNLDPVKAVEESWRITKGYGWRIFAMAILAFFIAIAGLIVFILGIIISIMWISTAFASMYQAVSQQKSEMDTVKMPAE